MRTRTSWVTRWPSCARARRICALATLLDGEGEARGLSRRSRRRGPTRHGAMGPSSSTRPSRQTRGVDVREASADRHAIDLLATERGVQQRLGHLAIVGEQQQALGLDVEPSDREQPHLPRLGGEHLDHRLAPHLRSVGVRGGAQHATWLVEQPVAQALPRERLPVHAHVVHGRIGALSERRDDAVHGHAPGTDEALGLPARGQACRSHELLDPLDHPSVLCRQSTTNGRIRDPCDRTPVELVGLRWLLVRLAVGDDLDHRLLRRRLGERRGAFFERGGVSVLVLGGLTGALRRSSSSISRRVGRSSSPFSPNTSRKRLVVL